MQRLLSWLRSTFTIQAVTFVAGLVAGVITQVVFGGIIQADLGLVLILVTILVVLAVATIVNVRNEIIEKLTQFGLSVHTHYAIKGSDGDRFLYDPVLAKINTAQRSLLVVSLYRPPTMKSSPARVRYYKTIDDLLEKHHRQGTRFRYERIVQVKNVTPGMIDNTQVDVTTLEHCKHVVELQNKTTSLTLQIRQMPDILGSLSFVIIDEKEIVFAIPMISRDEHAKLYALELGTGVTFTDYEGSLVREMLQLFDDLRLNADAVYSVRQSTVQQIK